ncbi:DUF5000 domain-containing lipoprotein [Proteiniphilum sp.]|uniref:DUF5000 domain-containing lipoprotein n=1 Tax=Proteiniphilum sp. TaxID=1926877 RepID=UPI002B201A64|nr:DUF5000 domain-containing lipoprotein [Proteiniphilum sp.]MEA4916861.1 DUF5000 domain-containing lipoprotein [Proteiniphilum sp.]
MKHIYIVLFCLSFLFSCNGDFEHEPIGGKGGSAPDPVKEVRVLRNTPGGAVLAYELPENVDIQYVRAEFTTSTGKLRDVKVSSYIDTLSISGLGDTSPRTVRLYTVNRKEIASQPVEVTINPLAPPIERIRNSMEYSVDFGGFLLQFKDNDVKEEVSIYVLKQTEGQGEMVEHQILYTSQQSDTLTVRGLPDEENRFGIYVRDRWDNISDTLFFTLTPWREDYLDKKLFKYIYIAGDETWNHYSGNPTRNAFDDVVGNTNFIHTAFPVEFPHRYTIDLGVDAKLSRFLLWQRPGADVLYQHGAPKHYRVYGRATDPGTGNANDPLEGWILLKECRSFKPSGLPLGQNSAEDEAFAAAGEEFVFPRDIPTVRYVRFEMLESWSGMLCSVVSELAFYGEVKE